MHKNPTHRTQPIVDATSMRVVAYEVLSNGRLPFGDADGMLRVDLSSLEYGALLAKTSGIRVHCNLEYHTLITATDEIERLVCAGIVVELVERHDILRHKRMFERVAKSAERLRAAGALIALDDVTLCSRERSLIRAVHPDIVKVDNRDALVSLCKATHGLQIVAERIEQEHQAELARLLGASMLQGFWCDRELRGCEHEAPTAIANEET